MAGHAILRYQDSTSSLPIDRNITDGPTCYLFQNIAETLDLVIQEVFGQRYIESDCSCGFVMKRGNKIHYLWAKILPVDRSTTHGPKITYGPKH